jgi:putative endonuclease
MTNRSRTLYTGVTTDLETRIRQHKQRADPHSFTAQYNIDVLVYFEEFTSINDAIAREKQIKGWTRNKKIALIESANPEWRDLSADWYRQ